MSLIPLKDTPEFRSKCRTTIYGDGLFTNNNDFNRDIGAGICQC